MKLALGTVQFGLPYGIANKRGQVSAVEVSNILSLARECAIDTLDTAIAYGQSEAILGNAGIRDFRVITKLPPLPDDIVDVERWVTDHVEASLRRLRADTLYGLLTHRSDNLHGAKGVMVRAAIDHLQQRGLVGKFGVSIYGAAELEALEECCSLQLVQAPLNVIDQRLVTSGWLERLNERGIEVHVRSAFLQGLLLMPRQAIPLRFERWAGLWDLWHKRLGDQHASASQVCLHYPLSLPEVDRVVIGVDGVDQLRQLIDEAQRPLLKLNWPEMICNDEALINPSKWRTT